MYENTDQMLPTFSPEIFQRPNGTWWICSNQTSCDGQRHYFVNPMAGIQIQAATA